MFRKMPFPKDLSMILNDDSDRKSLSQLEDKLNSLIAKNNTPRKSKKVPADSSPSTSKYKQLDVGTFFLKSPNNNTQLQTQVKEPNAFIKIPEKPTRGRKKTNGVEAKVASGRVNKRTRKNDTVSKLPLPTINRWIQKIKPTEDSDDFKKEKQKPDNGIENKKPAGKGSKLDKGTKAKPEKGKKSFKRSSSGSFDKYGVRTTSHKEAMEYQKKLEDQKRCMEALSGLEDSQESIEFNLDEPEEPQVTLDCTHLTKDQLHEAYDKNFQYIHDINSGVRYSKRHEQFEKGNYKDQSTLNYNTSMITFTIEQKHLLLAHLDEDFNEKLCPNPNTTKYFFKVLLPELCTKIFMDTHNMTYDEANEYLEDRKA